MRASLADQGLPDARTVSSMKNGVNIRYAGLVICRQRPGTAGGVVFMTMEDETGFVNVVIWESVFQRYSVLARTVSFLGITGKLQVEDGIVHLIANKLWEPRVELKPIGAPSRNFH
jgi:error-prone DNA polymerase